MLYFWWEDIREQREAVSVLVIIAAAVVVHLFVIIDSFFDCVLKGKYKLQKGLTLMFVLLCQLLIGRRIQVLSFSFPFDVTAAGIIHLANPMLDVSLAPSPYPGL